MPQDRYEVADDWQSSPWRIQVRSVRSANGTVWAVPCSVLLQHRAEKRAQFEEQEDEEGKDANDGGFLR